MRWAHEFALKSQVVKHLSMAEGFVNICFRQAIGQLPCNGYTLRKGCDNFRCSETASSETLDQLYYHVVLCDADCFVGGDRRLPDDLVFDGSFGWSSSGKERWLIIASGTRHASGTFSWGGSLLPLATLTCHVPLDSVMVKVVSGEFGEL